MPPSPEDARIRALRPRKREVDPWRPLDVLREEERGPGGKTRSAVTVFLAGSECPFTCVFCDLWRDTLDEPTPAGAIPAQLDEALRRIGALGAPGPGAAIKLYNASNFFDSRAVPRSDWPAIAERVRPFTAVTVESHPRLVGDACLELSTLLEPRLEVAMGLETCHPEALARLNKKMTLEDFDRAAALLRDHGIGLRAFVLVGTPFVPPAESVDWTVRSVEHALGRGAEVVSLIPLRGGNGEMERLRRVGEFAPPTLAVLEEALDRALDRATALGRGVVQADLWDLDRLGACDACAPGRRARLERINARGESEPRVDCRDCGGRGGEVVDGSL